MLRWGPGTLRGCTLHRGPAHVWVGVRLVLEMLYTVLVAGLARVVAAAGLTRLALHECVADERSGRLRTNEKGKNARSHTHTHTRTCTHLPLLFGFLLLFPLLCSSAR